MNGVEIPKVATLNNVNIFPMFEILPNLWNPLEVVRVRNGLYQSVECGGGGNCFFHTISCGLNQRGVFISYTEQREMLCDQLDVETNASYFQSILGATPNEIVPHLGHLEHHCPSGLGWNILTENQTWRDWGSYLRQDGRWAGGLEIVPMNFCLWLYGIRASVNLWKDDIKILCEDHLLPETILIMLRNNHFTLLRKM